MKSSGDKIGSSTVLDKELSTVPQDLYHSTAFGDHDIVNSDGLLLKHLESGGSGSGIELMGSLISGSKREPKCLTLINLETINTLLS